MFRRLFLVPLLLFCTAASAPDQLEQQVADLASADPEVRSEARIRLMDLDVSQLPRLADAAEALPSLDLNQRDALRVIVDHVAIASQVRNMMGMGGFLGVQFALDQAGDGVLVSICHIGLPAFQHLRPGDVIVGIRNGRWEPIRTGEDLRAAVMGAQAGDSITLNVRRGLQIKPVTVELAPNFTTLVPMAAQGQAIIDVQNRGMVVADQIWEANFAPLFEAQAIATVE